MPAGEAQIGGGDGHQVSIAIPAPFSIPLSELPRG
jgi:hypothetical protein